MQERWEGGGAGDQVVSCWPPRTLCLLFGLSGTRRPKTALPFAFSFLFFLQERSEGAGQGTKSMLAVGTAFADVEDTLARGRILLYDVSSQPGTGQVRRGVCLLCFGRTGGGH